MEIDQLKNLGVKCKEWLQIIEIETAEDLLKEDPFEIYARLKERVSGVNINILYGIIGAIEDIDWREIKRTRKEEILFRLDDMGLAPK